MLCVYNMYIDTYNTHTSWQKRELTGSRGVWWRGVSCCPVTSPFPSTPTPRSVKASHILISADGKAYLSGLRSNLSMISHGQRQRVVHDFPKYSIKVLPWLSPEVLQQVCAGSQGAASPPPQGTPRKPPGISRAGVPCSPLPSGGSVPGRRPLCRRVSLGSLLAWLLCAPSR